MSASVTVGFSPAVTSVVSGGGTTSAAGDSASSEGGLFGAILALLGSALTGATETAAADATAKLPADVAKVAAPLIDALGQVKDIKASDSGKSLLADLGDALTAAGDAAASGNPVDPATRKKLEDALDQIGAMLVTVPVAAQASATVPATDDAAVAVDPVAAAPVAAPVSPDTPVVPAIPAPASPDSEIDDADADTDSDVKTTADAASDPAAAAVVTSPNVPAPVADTTTPSTDDSTTQAMTVAVQPAIEKLAKLVEKLSEDVRATSPVLADKLKAFATELETTGATPQLLEKLGLTTDAATELTKMVAALSAPKPAAKTSAATTATSDFAEPVLSDKGKLTGTASDDSADPATPQAQSAAPAPTPATAPDAPAIKPVTLDFTQTAAKPAEKSTDAVDAVAPAAKADASVAADPASAASQQAAAATTTAAPARAIHAAYQSPLQQVNYPQVAFEVARQVTAGNSRFQIRLDPPELGRIDVKLDLDKHGTVNARMVVERPETLDLMQRDQRALQQALQQAGIDSSKTNLEFSLRQNPFAGSFAGQGNGGNSSGQNGYGTNPQVSAEATEVAPLPSVYRGTATAGGVNLFV